MAGIETRYLYPPADILMRVPDDVRKCVVFLGKEVGVEKVYGGTAFFVGISSKTTPLHFMYLVTAKHCADALEGIDFWVRVNSKSGDVLELKANSNARWFRHPVDPDHVDVAVLPFLYQSDIDATHINLYSFYTKALAPTIGTGDEVFITGLFALAKGAQRNMPIVRMGNIAMMPDDKIPVKKFGEIDAYLIEARSSGGVSGSPVFVRETMVANQSDSQEDVHGVSSKFWLLGLMNGHWEIDPAKLNDVVIRGVDIGVNLGIAIVVPAYKIVEVLRHPELVEMRKFIENDWKATQQTSKLDTAFPPSKEKTFTKDDFESALKKVSRKIPPKN
jgi:hypothetical protein